MYVCMYICISLFSQLHRSVNLGKKKIKTFLLAAVCGVEESLLFQESHTFEALCQEGFALVRSRTQSVCRLLNAELLRFDLRDPNIDIFTVPLTM